MTFQLRDYQRDAIDAAYRHLYERDLDGTIIHLATGLGKTRIAAEFIARHFDLNKQRVMFVVHTTDLVLQTYFSFLELHPEWSERCYTKYGFPGIGIVMGEKYNQSDARVIIGTPQTLSGTDTISNRLSDVLEFGTFDLIIIDEAHYGASQSYLNLCAALLPAKRLGLTATPMRTDGMALRQPIPNSKEVLFETICISRNVKWGIANGYLCPIANDGRPLLIETNIALPERRGKGFEERAALIDVENWTELVVDAYQLHGEERLAAYYLPSVEHSIKAWEEFHDHGIDAVHVDGDSLIFPDGTKYTGQKAKDMRKIAYDMAYKREVDVFCNYNVLTHGWDMPPISLIGQARPTDSPVLWAQMIGRGTRLDKSKEDLLILDYALKDIPFILSGSLLGFTWDEKRKEMVEDPEAEVENITDGVDLRDLKPEETLVDGNGIVTRLGNLFKKFNEAWYSGDAAMTLGLSENHMLLVLQPNYTLSNRVTEGIQKGQEFLIENPDNESGRKFYQVLTAAHHLSSEYTLWHLERKTKDDPYEAQWVAHADSAELVFDYALPLIEEHEDPILSKKKRDWRRHKPSDAQLYKLRGYGIMNFTGTKGDASHLIGYHSGMQSVKKIYSIIMRKAGQYGTSS